MRSKSDEPLENINVSRVYSPPRDAEYSGPTPINGFDTETADGNVFMLSYAWMGEEPESVDANGAFLEPSTIWKYLTHRRAEGAVNVWYNLDFDANVLLSQVLTGRQMARLVVGTSVDTGRYEVDFIPGKFLKISHGNHVYYHYDISQFFFAPLDKAANEVLGIGKLPDVDTSAFGALIGPTRDGRPRTRVNDYILDNWFRIREYARRDAQLTRDLWVETVDAGESDKLDIPMGKPFSTGYLAESYLREHLEQKPGIGPKAVARLAWDAMKGGRFEAFKRGNVGRVVGPDINSAYPAVLSELPDPATLQWQRVYDMSEFPNADYGFVDATVTTADAKIQPFGTKVDGKLTYPQLNGVRIQTILPIFRFAVENGLIERAHIHKAWLGYESPATRFPFRDELDIPGLYTQRKEYGEKELALFEMLLKIVLNSMYGKTAQTTVRRKPTPTDRALKEYEHYVPELSLPPSLRDEYAEGFVETLDAGAWFNPFLAAYITGLTRLELHKRVVEYGLEDATVMFATDSVMIEADAFEATSFRDDLTPDDGTPYSEQLGQWDFDYEGRGFVIGSGVYDVAYRDDETGRMKSKVATRGFREKDLSDQLKADCRSTARSGEDAVRVESLRPKTMAEAIWLGTGEPGGIGVFQEDERKLSADMDTKRDWHRGDVTFTDLLRGSEESDPLVFDG